MDKKEEQEKGGGGRREEEERVGEGKDVRVGERARERTK